MMCVRQYHKVCCEIAEGKTKADSVTVENDCKSHPTSNYNSEAY